MIENLPASYFAVAKDARKFLRPLRRDLLGLLRELIRVNTVAVPPNGNGARSRLRSCFGARSNSRYRGPSGTDPSFRRGEGRCLAAQISA